MIIFILKRISHKKKHFHPTTKITISPSLPAAALPQNGWKAV